MLDLGAYLQHISYVGDHTPSLAVLRPVHEAHALSIPFENLDIVLGRSIRIEIDSVQAKRGGYCFEQNCLLAAALQVLGFQVQTLIARVRYRATTVRARPHMMMLVQIDGALPTGVTVRMRKSVNRDVKFAAMLMDKTHRFLQFFLGKVKAGEVTGIGIIF